MDIKPSLSLPDDTFAAAEVLARRLGLSRSELYALAIAEFVEAQRRQGATERLEAGYREQASGTDPAPDALLWFPLPRVTG